MTFLLDHELALVRHALGCWDGYGRRALEGYRNHFVTSDGSKADAVWQSLVTRGLAESRPFNLDQIGSSTIYFVTREGARLAGLSEAAIVRACGTREEQAKQRAKYRRDRERRALLALDALVALDAMLADRDAERFARADADDALRRAGLSDGETRRREAAGE